MKASQLQTVLARSTFSFTAKSSITIVYVACIYFHINNEAT